MLDKILKQDATEGMSSYEIEKEKIKRERNRLLGEKKLLIQEIQKREKILETTETYLIQRIQKLKESGISKTAIYELEILLDGLKEERVEVTRRSKHD